MSPTQREFVRYKIMQTLAKNPEASQRQLAREFGVSLGSVNYCIKALIDKGLLKVETFSKSNTKIGYSYMLTPTGVKEKGEITINFLKRKKQEYALLKQEIKEIETSIKQDQKD